MTITLYWWVFPLIVFVLGVSYFFLHESNSGYFSGIENVFVLIITIFVTVSLIIGHFL